MDTRQALTQTQTTPGCADPALHSQYSNSQCNSVSRERQKTMADYREISQEYARGGIKAALLINAGAAVALLSQIADLAIVATGEYIRHAMLVWAFGVFAASTAWLCAFFSTRYVDKSEREASQSDMHISKSNTWMNAGLVLVGISLLCFLAGSIVLACALG